MSSTGRNLYIDVPLSNVVVGRNPSGFIADKLLNTIPVSKQSALFWKLIDPKDRFRHEAGISARAPMAEPRKVTFSISSDNYFAKNYALAAEWPVEDEANADGQIDLAEGNAFNVVTKLKYDYEMRVASLAATTANISTTTQVATSWALKSGANIFSDLSDNIETFRQITGIKPNRLVIPEQVMRYVRRNDELRTMIYGTNNGGGTVGIDQLVNLLGMNDGLTPGLNGEVNKAIGLVPYILVNTTGEQETENGSGSLSNVWDNRVHLFYQSPLAGTLGAPQDTWGQAFLWTSPKFGVPWAVRRAPTDEKKGAEYLDVQYYQDEKIVSPDLHLRIESVM